MNEAGEVPPQSVPSAGRARLTQPQVLVALIGALGGVAVAVVTGVFTVLAGWVQLGGGPAASGPAPTVTVTQTVTVESGSGSEVSDPEGDDGDATGETEGPSGEGAMTYLSDLNPVEEEGDWRDGEVPIEGETFQHGMVASLFLCDAYRTYRIDGTYERFRAQAAFAATNSAESTDVLVFVDGVQVWGGQVVAGELLPIDVDVRAARELRILLDTHCGSGELVLGFGDPRLTEAEPR